MEQKLARLADRLDDMIGEINDLTDTVARSEVLVSDNDQCALRIARAAASLANLGHALLANQSGVASNLRAIEKAATKKKVF